MTGIMMSHAAIAAQAGASGGGGGDTTYTQGVDFTTLFATSQGFTGTVNKINFGVSYSNTGPLTTLPIGTTVTFTFLDRGSLQPVNVTFTTTETATTFDDTDNSLMVYGYLGTVVVNSGTITDDFGAAGGSAQAGATAVVTEGDGSGGGGGGPTGDVTGTITVGTNADFGVRYGYSSSFLIYGSISATPAAIPLFFTDPGLYTRVQFNGTTIGTTPTDSMMGTATGVTSLSVTVDGITRTLTTGGPSAGGYSIAGDPFGFASKNGQTLPFSITLA